MEAVVSETDYLDASQNIAQGVGWIQEEKLTQQIFATSCLADEE